MYLTRQDALQVITRMQDFESQLKNLFGDYDYDLHENIGRRNMLLSAIQVDQGADRAPHLPFFGRDEAQGAGELVQCLLSAERDHP